MSCCGLEWSDVLAEARCEINFSSGDLLSKELSTECVLRASMRPFRNLVREDDCSFADACFLWCSSFRFCSTSDSWISQEVLSTHGGQSGTAGSSAEAPAAVTRVPFNVCWCFSSSRAHLSAHLSSCPTALWEFWLIAWAWLAPLLFPGHSKVIQSSIA